MKFELPWIKITRNNLAIAGLVGQAIMGPWAFDNKMLFGFSALMVLPFIVSACIQALRSEGERGSPVNSVEGGEK